MERRRRAGSARRHRCNERSGSEADHRRKETYQSALIKNMSSWGAKRRRISERWNTFMFRDSSPSAQNDTFCGFSSVERKAHFRSLLSFRMTAERLCRSKWFSCSALRPAALRRTAQSRRRNVNSNLVRKLRAGDRHHSKRARRASCAELCKLRCKAWLSDYNHPFRWRWLFVLRRRHVQQAVAAIIRGAFVRLSVSDFSYSNTALIAFM